MCNESFNEKKKNINLRICNLMRYLKVILQKNNQF